MLYKVTAFACRTLGSCIFEIRRGQLELARARRLARSVSVGWLCQPFTLSALRKQVSSLCERPVPALEHRGGRPHTLHDTNLAAVNTR